MKYVALLRGINVSGQKKIRMADLTEMLLGIGLKKVVTYIQSGNVIFKSEEKNTRFLEEKIKKGIADTFGFDVTVLVKTRDNLEKILQDSPYTEPKDIAAKKIYYTLLHQEPEKAFFSNLNPIDYPDELFQIGKNCVYLNCTKGAGMAKLNNNVIERKLKVSATTRNHRTLLKLLELSLEN